MTATSPLYATVFYAAVFSGVLRRITLASLFVWALALSNVAFAQDDEENPDEPAAPESIYLPLKPSFIVNYGGIGRLRYIKADLTARLSTQEAAEAVRHHLPYVRNNINRLFASQTDETIESQEGKEALRQEALREIQALIMEEEEIEGVEDLYFNSLIIQR